MKTILTADEYNSLPDRNSTTEYVVDAFYRDPDSPDFIFMYLGESRTRSISWASFHWRAQWQQDSANSG